jgi:hypothetical protein
MYVPKYPWQPTSFLERLGPADFDMFVCSVCDNYPDYVSQMYPKLRPSPSGLRTEFGTFN